MGEREIVGKDPADIRRDIEDTRASIGEKLEALESQVKDTADSVKSSALATIDDVKQNFSFHHHMQERPWTMFCGAIGVGFVVGSLLSHKLSDHEPDLNPQAVWSPQLVKAGNGHTNGHGANGHGNGHKSASSIASQTALLSGLTTGLTGILGQTFAPELRKARQLAIGTVLGIVREIARDTVPTSMADKTVQVIDEITKHLGGEPARQRVKPPTAQFATP